MARNGLDIWKRSIDRIKKISYQNMCINFFGTHFVTRIFSKVPALRYPGLARWNHIWFNYKTAEWMPLEVYGSWDIGCSLTQLRSMKFTLFVRMLSSKISITSNQKNGKRWFISRFEENSHGYRTGEYQYCMIRNSWLMSETSVYSTQIITFYAFSTDLLSRLLNGCIYSMKTLHLFNKI